MILLSLKNLTIYLCLKYINLLTFMGSLFISSISHFNLSLEELEPINFSWESLKWF